MYLSRNVTFLVYRNTYPQPVLSHCAIVISRRGSRHVLVTFTNTVTKTKPNKQKTQKQLKKERADFGSWYPCFLDPLCLSKTNEMCVSEQLLISWWTWSREKSLGNVQLLKHGSVSSTARRPLPPKVCTTLRSSQTSENPVPICLQKIFHIQSMNCHNTRDHFGMTSLKTMPAWPLCRAINCYVVPSHWTEKEAQWIQMSILGSIWVDLAPRVAGSQEQEC